MNDDTRGAKSDALIAAARRDGEDAAAGWASEIRLFTGWVRLSEEETQDGMNIYHGLMSCCRQLLARDELTPAQRLYTERLQELLRLGYLAHVGSAAS